MSVDEAKIGMVGDEVRDDCVPLGDIWRCIFKRERNPRIYATAEISMGSIWPQTVDWYLWQQLV